jgi:hypothetical protein
LREGLNDLAQGLRRTLGPLVEAAARYYADLQAQAETFRRLIPLGAEGWAISTYGLMAVPDAHRAAADSTHDLARASAMLEEGWSDSGARLCICGLVPYVYRPDDRDIALRRQELLERASDNFSHDRYEETVLLVYSQLDGIYRDKAASVGEQALADIFSRKGDYSEQSDRVRAFRDIVTESRTMSGAEPEFFLHVRDALTESVRSTTLEDKASRHGVLHGRVLGYGNRRRAAQAFAFLAASLELLIALEGGPLMTEEEAHVLRPEEAPVGLNFIVLAGSYLPVRSVYLATRGLGNDVFLATEESPQDLDAAERQP